MSILPDSANYDADVPYWAALSTFPKFGPKRFSLLRHYFPAMKNAWEAGLHDLQAAGINEQTAMEFIEHRQGIDSNAEMEKLVAENITVLPIIDRRYPRLLKEIYDPPALLYCRGNIPANINFCIAIVGARKYSPYGQQAAQTLAADLSAAGLGIVSGLALGIDAIAHFACLRTGGNAIAVLGSGVNNSSIYPATNRNLAEQILAAGGWLISEYPYGTPALQHHFPQRNRIISGLSLGTLVIEAAEKSGALITAACALEQNREIFAVPGSIFSQNCRGTNNLIKSGAKAATSAADIIDALALDNVKHFVRSQKAVAATPLEEKILKTLSREATHINLLSREAKLDTAAVNATLLTMELKGMVRNIGGGNYVLA